MPERVFQTAFSTTAGPLCETSSELVFRDPTQCRWWVTFTESIYRRFAISDEASLQESAVKLEKLGL